MTEELQPELGSGALREALERLDVRPCNMNPCDHFPKHTWEPILATVREAALSLSSSIEPAATVPEELWQVVKRLHERFHHGGFTNWPAIANRLTVWLAANRPQASSEIRAKMMASFDKVIPSFEMRVQIVSCILRALKS